MIRADERKVRQVIFNLLSNAVKFTPPGGHVDVSAFVADGMVEVAVTDTGLGIVQEDHERIFEEFQQARDSSHGSREGTGLGLTPLAAVHRAARGTSLGGERTGAGAPSGSRSLEQRR